MVQCQQWTGSKARLTTTKGEEMSVTKSLAKKFRKKIKELEMIEPSSEEGLYPDPYFNRLRLARRCEGLHQEVMECLDLLKEAVAENDPPQKPKQAPEDIRGEDYQTEGEWYASQLWGGL